MQNIKIEGLDQLNELLALLVSVLAVDKGMEKTAKAAEEMQFKEEEEEENESIEVETSITQEQVRAAFVKVNSPNNRSTLKELLNKYEAKSVSDLDSKHYENIMKELEELK